MRIRSIVWFLVVALLAAGAATATAATSLADEVAAGQALSARLQSGQVTCAQLSEDDFDHLGEYVMNRMVGSPALHEAMNARMTAMMGADNEARMHVVMGQRYAGCATSTTGGVMGPAMMGGAGGPGGGSAWGQMMGSGMWSWMSGGQWQQMSRGAWQRVGDQWLGAGMMLPARDGWGVGDTALIVGGTLLAATAAVGGLLLWRRHGGATPPART